MHECAVICQALKPKSKANAPSISSYSYIHEKINTRASGRGGCWRRGRGWYESERQLALALPSATLSRLPSAWLGTLNRGFSLSCVKRVSSNVCVWLCELFTSLATDEVVSAVLHQLQDPLVLSVDALPRWVTWSMQVRQVPTRAKTTHIYTNKEGQKGKSTPIVVRCWLVGRHRKEEDRAEHSVK